MPRAVSDRERRDILETYLRSRSKFVQAIRMVTETNEIEKQNRRTQQDEYTQQQRLLLLEEVNQF